MKIIYIYIYILQQLMLLKNNIILYYFVFVGRWWHFNVLKNNDFVIYPSWYFVSTIWIPIWIFFFLTFRSSLTWNLRSTSGWRCWRESGCSWGGLAVMAIIAVLEDELLVLDMVVLWTLRLVVLVGDGLTITSNYLFSWWCMCHCSLGSIVLLLY